GFSRDGGRHAHLEHPVSDHAWQAHGAGNFVVQVDRVHVAGCLRVSGDLLAGQGDLSCGHESARAPAARTSWRMTNRARERQTGAPCSSLVSVSYETNRMPRRFVSDATRAREVPVSPTSG